MTVMRMKLIRPDPPVIAPRRHIGQHLDQLSIGKHLEQTHLSLGLMLEVESEVNTYFLI